MVIAHFIPMPSTGMTSILTQSLNRWVYGKVVYPAVVRGIGEGILFQRLRALEAMQWWSHERLAGLQAERLAELLSFAADHTTHYQERIGKVRPGGDEAAGLLASLPILEKSDIQTSVDALVSRPAPGPIAWKTTGGSTGQAVTIAKDRVALAHERAAMWLGYGWSGIHFGDRCARFWGSQFDGRRRAVGRAGDFAMNRVRFSAFAFDDADLERYWRQCLAFQPDYLYGYVSMLEAFASFLERKGYDGRMLGARAVIPTSEVLSPPQRVLLERVFGVRVAIEYGCGEVGPIAYECEKGSLHLMVTDLVVEFLDRDDKPVEKGETGQIVLTDLNSKAMPLIRYRIGDNGIAGESCECGRGLPVLAKIWGRAYDVVQGLDGRRFHGEFFMYLFEDLRKAGHDIKQFQVIQEERAHLNVLISSSDATIAAITPDIRRRLETSLPGMTIGVERREKIERSPSGKMQIVRNRLLRLAQAT
jgi:phenylacetate-CoA ligase